MSGLSQRRAYGLTLALDFPLRTRLPGSSDPLDLTIRLVEKPPLSGWERRNPTFVSPVRMEDGRSTILLYRMGEVDVLSCTGVADFYVWEDRIEFSPLDPALGFAIEIFLLGIVLAYWLERRGSPMLHASAVAIEGRAVAFLATNRAGKSSLAATLMQVGHPLLTDDLLRLDVNETVAAYPGYPQMRMWPEVAEHFLDRFEDLDLVHPELTKRRVPVGRGGLGEFCDGTRPLGRIYLPTRRDAGDPSSAVEIRPVPPGQALIELVRGSFLPRITQAAGFQERRLGRLARLARDVPMRELIYPSGLSSLPAVREAVLADLDGSRMPRSG
ncbi:MAG TPA: hypothetical protein VM737_06170 [Gemmatimonadota bacterium]|nr:hypothetical protein [Gemmatimonadota bacterium]